MRSIKIKIVDAIRRTSDEQIAKIIGAVVLQHTAGITAEEAIELDYPNTLKELLREIDIYYKQTNADRIRSMMDEELAKFFAIVTEDVLCGSMWSKNGWKKWLQSEAEG